MLPRVEREADQQRIVIGRDGQAVLREHADVIFEIVADLQHRIVGEQSAEPRERVLHRNLVRLFGEHVGAAVAERDVTGLARRGRQADPDQIAGHAVEAGGFGVDRDDMRRARLRDPAVERVEAGHTFIGGAVDRGHRRQHRGRRRGGGGRRCGRFGVGRRRRAAGRRADVELGRQRAKAMFVEEQLERRGRDFAQLHFIQRLRQRHVALQVDQHARQPRHVGMFDQIVAQLRRLHRLGAGQRGFQIAIFLDQLGRGLGPDAAHAGDIVDAVAHQRQHVADQIGGDAELLVHLGQPHVDVLHRVEHVDLRPFGGLADQLHQILVGRHDGDVPAFAHRRLGIAGDQIVGLEARHFDARQ